MSQRVELWCQLLMGFRQDHGEMPGLEQLYYALRRTHGNWPNEIQLATWRESTPVLADMIQAQLSPRGKIILIGYSRGGGAAVRLAWELHRRRQKIDALFLIDPVGFTHPALLPINIAYALGWLPLEIPANVRRAWTWRQERDYPRGNRLIINKPTKLHAASTRHHVKHVRMDELDAPRAQIFDTLAQLTP